MDRYELQQGLNQVVANKVNRMISDRQPLVQQTIQRLINEGREAQDFIAPIGVEQRRAGYRPAITFADDRHLTMQLENGAYTLHTNAVGQLAEKMGIPSKYLRELSQGGEWQRRLSAQILNEHASWTPRSRVLIRAVGSEVRGVLSDSYKRLNSEQILTSFLQVALDNGAQACDALMTDTKVFVETILPKPLCIPTRLNGQVIIYMGARFSTSDYGDGAVDMRAFLLNGVCLNGMVRESTMKHIHLGARLQQDLQLSNETYRLDTQATVSAVKDVTRQLFAPENIEKKAREIHAASELEVDFDSELKRLVKNNWLNKNECEGVQKLLMNNNPEDGLQGGATLWKLTQAITAYGRDLNSDRTRELHEVAGLMIDRALRK